MNNSYNLISNNVNGIKGSEKHLKLFEYLRNNINNNGFVFLQETHLLLKVEQKWKDDFSCGVSIGEQKLLENRNF